MMTTTLRLRGLSLDAMFDLLRALASESGRDHPFVYQMHLHHVLLQGPLTTEVFRELLQGLPSDPNVRCSIRDRVSAVLVRNQGVEITFATDPARGTISGTLLLYGPAEAAAMLAERTQYRWEDVLANAA